MSLRKHQLASGYVKIAIENGSFGLDLPIEHGDFPIAMAIYSYIELPNG